jgi:hypothetical protein
MDKPKRGQRSATNHHKQMQKQMMQADHMRKPKKTSASNAAGTSVGSASSG